MIFEELQVDITSSSDVEFSDSDRTGTLAGSARLACAAHAGAASLAECRDLCEWFGVDRRRATIQHWYQAYAEHYDQDFTVEPDRVAADEKQIQLEMNRKYGSTLQLTWMRKSCCTYDFRGVEAVILLNSSLTN
jgi:putative transposase